MVNGRPATPRVVRRPRRKSPEPGVNLNGQKRDNQRSKLYAAQRIMGGNGGADRHPGTPLPKNATVAECQSYVDGILGSAWWRDYVGARLRKVTVKDGRGRNSAASYYYERAISIPRYQRTRPVVIHELAHQAVDRIHGGPNEVAPHGPEYAGVLVSMVSRFLGTAAAAELRDSYRKHGVKIRLPQKRGSR